MEQFENLGLGDIWCGKYRKIGINGSTVIALEICLKSDEHTDECAYIVFHGSLACTDMRGVPCTPTFTEEGRR